MGYHQDQDIMGIEGDVGFNLQIWMILVCLKVMYPKIWCWIIMPPIKMAILRVKMWEHPIFGCQMQIWGWAKGSWNPIVNAKLASTGFMDVHPPRKMYFIVFDPQPYHQYENTSNKNGKDLWVSLKIWCPYAEPSPGRRKIWHRLQGCSHQHEEMICGWYVPVFPLKNVVYHLIHS